MKLDLAVLVANPDNTFLTSDTPCTWFDPNAFKRPKPLQFPFIQSPLIEIVLPVTPLFALFFNRQKVSEYIDFNDPGIDDFNLRVIDYCKEWFISQSKMHKYAKAC